MHSPLRFADAVRVAAATGPALIPWDEERARTLREVSAALLASANPPAAVSLFIGPEGGFSTGEVALAREQGLAPVTLGPRILRAETAALVVTALTIANAEHGPGTRLRVANSEQDEDG